MSTHLVCFRGEIRKVLCGYLLLPRATCMVIYLVSDQSGNVLQTLSVSAVCATDNGIAPDKALFFSIQKVLIFSYFSTKTCFGYSLEAP